MNKVVNLTAKVVSSWGLGPASCLELLLGHDTPAALLITSVEMQDFTKVICEIARRRFSLRCSHPEAV